MVGYIKDPWNATEEEITRWAFSEDVWPDQDWDLSVSDEKNWNLIYRLANDLRCNRADFFIHCLYYIVGEAAYHNDSDKMTKVKEWVEALPPSGNDEIDKWKTEARELLNGEREFVYQYWCGYMFQKSNPTST